MRVSEKGHHHILDHVSYQVEGYAGTYDLEVKSPVFHSAFIALSYFYSDSVVSAQVISAPNSVEELQI